MGFPSETEMDSAVSLRGEKRKGDCFMCDQKLVLALGFMVCTRSGCSWGRSGDGLEALLPLLEHISGVK